MAFDAICLHAVLHEISAAVDGAHIDKIFQPLKDTLILSLRGKKSEHLLLCANPGAPRIYLTSRNRENPDKPPMFCMLMRKYLTGGRITEVEQPNNDRIAAIHIVSTNEFGDRVNLTLILEMIGRASNILLVGEDGRIIDCIRHYSSDRVERKLLPGLFYHLPEPQKKLQLGKDDPRVLFQKNQGRNVLVSKLLLESVEGLSPLTSREAVYRATNYTDKSMDELQEHQIDLICDFLQEIYKCVQNESYMPCIVSIGGKAKEFSYMEIKQYENAAEIHRYESFSEMLEEFYFQREADERMRTLGSDLIKLTNTLEKRLQKKLENQREELRDTKDRERLKRYGDLITANIYAMNSYQENVTLKDFYEKGEPLVTIRLDPRLSPQKNAAKYYKEYHKAQTAETMLTRQIQKNEKDLEYIRSVRQSLGTAESERDFEEIRQELAETGFIRGSRGISKNKRKSGKQTSKPLCFRASDGQRIFVGKNNVQNDFLTFHSADKNDLWFHVEKFHGSHVILETGDKKATEKSIQEAAELAACFSQARETGTVPVNYTTIANVRKPAGARPGMVVFKHYQTIFVSSDLKIASKLQKL